jgi:hypothetical protein
MYFFQHKISQKYNLEDTIKTIKDMANKVNKDPNNFEVILLTYTNIVDSKSQTINEENQRFPLYLRPN